MNLNQLLEEYQKLGILLEKNISVDENSEVKDIADNSKTVAKGAVFFCKGAHFKEEYLLKSMEIGALAFVTESSDLFHVEKNGILVTDIRKAMVLTANLYFQKAWEKLKLIGITGTKGKSTTTYLLKSIIDTYCTKNGLMPSGVLSSIENYDGVVLEESHLTTPEPIDLHRHFYNMVKNKIEFCVMEVSSQALKFNRVEGITFNIGGFLNIGRDHISDIEHKDFEDYFSSKTKLFEISNSMFINENLKFDASGFDLKTYKGELAYFGFTEKSQIRCFEYHKVNKGYEFFVEDTGIIEKYFLPMAGVFNIENALCAIGIAKKLSIPYDSIFTGLKNARVNGRMELFTSENENMIVIVDYAHNRLSFEKLYDSVKAEYPDYKITTVFGCPGGKAQERRKDLGEISGFKSDIVIITEEDPGEESLIEICKEIYGYAEGKKGKVEIILDRESAIHQAINNQLQEKQIILITGKGRETRQKRGVEYIETKSDVEITIEALNEFNKNFNI